MVDSNAMLMPLFLPPVIW